MPKIFKASKDSKSFSVVDLVEESIEKDFSIPDSMSVDDSDLPLAPNFYTWVRSKEYLNQTMFPRHIQIGMWFFNDFCPLCSNRKYIHNLFDQDEEEILENITFLEHGVCPNCGVSRAHLIKAKLFPDYYDELVGVAGQRSSKTAFTAVIATYVLHRFMKLPGGTPAKFFNMPATVLHMTFTAITYEQARDTLWQWFKDYIDDSPWFQEYFNLLRDYELRLSTQLLANKDTFLAIRNKRLLCYPATPDKRKLRGRTRFFYAVDEFSYFNASETSKSVKFNAAEIYAALENSLQTLKSAINAKRRLGFYNIPSACSVLVSSPVSKTDKLMQLLRKAGLVSTRYAFHYPTWEFNPNITFEDLKSKFEENPIIAARDFGADPPLNDAPLISNRKVIERCFKKRRQPVRTVQVFNEELSVTTVKVKPAVSGKPRLKNNESRRVLCLDAGMTNNSFAACVSHLRDDKLVVDALVEIIPLRGCSVNFTMVERDVLPVLIELFDPVLIAADRWQSESILSNIASDYDCFAGYTTYSCTYQDMMYFKQLILEQRCIFPKTEVHFRDLIDASFDYPSFFVNKPVSHFAYQILTVRDTGRRVDKGFHSTDDLFRAVALSVSILHDEEYAGVLLTADSDDSEAHAADSGVSDRTAGVVMPRNVFGGGGVTTTGASSSLGGVGQPSAPVVIMPRSF